jgi:hypothetical protein
MLRILMCGYNNNAEQLGGKKFEGFRSAAGEV